MSDSTYPFVVIAGPTGVGKTTVIKLLRAKYPQIQTSVTYTTRAPRPWAQEDKIMHHVDREEFERRRDAGEFLEWALVHGEYYGTHKGETEALLSRGVVLGNIDVQGAEQLKALYKDRMITLFLAPESFDQIIEHVKRRGNMTESELEARLDSAKKELARQDEFDHIVLNREGKLDETVKAVEKILKPYLDKTA